MKKVIFTLIGFLLVCGIQAQEIPQKISYQGKLVEDGFPVNGIKSITFTIGSSWSELHYVQITEGIYTVTLGEINPIPIDLFNNNSILQLQISVEGNTLSPHTEILSVPYSYKSENAADAERIAGKEVSPLNPSEDQVLKWYDSKWTPQDDDTHPTGSAGGDLTDQYPNPTVRRIQNNDVSPVDPSTDQVLKWNGLEWTPQTDATLDGSEAGGDLSGTYPNPTVSGLQNKPISLTVPIDEQVLKYDGSQWTPENDGLILPYSGTYSGSSPAFQITNNGNNDAFKIDNNGTSGALFVSNDANSDWGVYISNQSDEDALHISNSGTGRTLSATNSNIAYDGNPCAYFHILEPTNDGPVIYAVTNGTGYAGYFGGDVHITGTLTGGKSYSKMDHPLDPENKYLYHSSMESPDMMNVYNGNITTDDNGIAIIQLPDYFEKLNKDFRYQLTCIGVFSQAIIYEKINNNQFTIKTEIPNVEVSWQVTGIRQDPYANQNRIQVEVEKTSKEKGHYLHYKEYNQPIENSIEAVKNPALLKELKENK